MNIYSILPFITGCTLAALGLFVYSNNRRSRVNIIFALFCFSMVWWLLGYSAMYMSTDPYKALSRARFAFYGIIFIPILAFHFIAAFLGIRSRVFLGLIYLSSIPSIILTRTDLIYSSVKDHFWGFYPVAGKFYVFFLAQFLILFCSALSLLLMKLKDKEFPALRRKQVAYVLVAFAIGTVGVVDYIVKFPGVAEIYPFGYACALIFISIIAYSIVRHSFLDIKVIIRKTLVFAGIFAVVYAILSSFAYLGSILFENIVHSRIIAMVPSVLMIVLILRPLERLLKNITDKYLFQINYDYKKLMKTFVEEVLTVLDLKRLVTLTVNKLGGIMRLESATILLYDEEKKQFSMSASTGAVDSGYILPGDHSIAKYMIEAGKYIILERVASGETPLHEYVDEDIIGVISGLNSTFAIPLMQHKNLMGILFLGNKKSDEEFSSDDIDILLPLARTLSIAITNALLFKKLSMAQARAAQREKMAVVGTLSAGINHEICNPLGIARGLCEMFLLNHKEGFYDDTNTDELLEKTLEILNKVIHEVDRATMITKRLSSFAKPSKEDNVDHVSVVTELDEVILLVDRELKLSNIKMIKEIQDDLPLILADRKQIQEILFNIIRNAAQSIKGNGTISIRGARAMKDRVRIDIEDTGTGIGMEDLGRIFDPFFTTKEPGQGTGLGLFIVKQIIERNKGVITVESELGKGTVFHLEFSTVEQSKEGAQSQPAELS